MQNVNVVHIAIVVQFYSGLKQIIDENKWSHSGSPAYYNFVKQLDRHAEFTYQLIFLETSKSSNKIQLLQLENLNNKLIVVPYYSLLMSNHINLIKKIENFYNKIRQYIVVFKFTKSTKFYYVDRDNFIFSFFALRFKDAKVVIRLLGITENLYQYLTEKKNILSRIIKWVFNHPNVNFICSNDGSFAEVVKSQYKDKFHLLFNGVDKNLKRNFQPSNKLKIVYLSRIVNNKGHTDFIQGISKSKVTNQLEVKIIGEGNLKNHLELMVRDLNLEENIHFIGRLSHNDALLELSKADLVFSINYDGVFGNVVLEASQMGIPLAVLSHSGCLSLSQYNFFELEKDSYLVENIAKTLDKAVKDKVWLNDLSKRSEQFAENHLVNWNQRIDSELLIVKNFFYN